MTKSKWLYAVFLISISSFFWACTCSTNKLSEKDKEIESKIDALIKKMSIEEKAGQMTQVTIDVILATDENGKISEPQRIDTAKLTRAVKKYNVGSILNVVDHCFTREEWLKIISSIDAESKKTKMQIPVLYGIDAIHGINYTQGATLFPQQIALAATWNPSIIEQSAAISAYETRASYIPWTFSPICDVGRNPVWPRFWETFGEDVFLASEMSKSMIIGYQGNDIANKEKVAACLKHYMGYSFPLSGRDRTPAWIPENYLREYFLPSFKASIDAGAWSVMVNSAEINGTPVHANRHILTNILKGELAFKGFAVSDWEDIKYLYNRHKIAESQKDAVRIAVNAGIDMSMVPFDFTFTDYLIELIKEGKVPVSRIDDAVRRILRVKFHAGIFDKMMYDASEYPKFGSKEHQTASYNAACEAVTLLKNEKNTLPLSKSAKILVTGPTANTMTSLNGGWTYNWQGTLADKYAAGENTMYEAIKNIGGSNISFVEDKTFNTTEKIQEAVKAAQNADYIVLCLGEFSYTESVGNIDDLTLPFGQINLAYELSKTGKPIILVLLEGRPRIIHKISEFMNAIVMGYYPGNKGGDAIASILYGDVNPSGKLPFTYPRYTNNYTTYDHKHTEEIENMNWNPQFEFGYGLSYTSFEYSDLHVDKQDFTSEDSVLISVNVKNTGKREGKEVVQLYVKDMVASITPPVKRLRGFKKISLKPGENQTVEFKITSKALAFVDINNKWITEKGDFEVIISNLKQPIKFN